MILLHVQNLIACTKQIYVYSPYVSNDLYKARLPVQYSTISSPIMSSTDFTEPQYLYSTVKYLFHLWAIKDVQILNICIVELYIDSPLDRTDFSEFSTSTVLLYMYPPMCSRDCTEPHCL